LYKIKYIIYIYIPISSPSTDFERILVKDDRLGSITDKIKYAVLKGGQNVTSQTFNAISYTTSSHVFNIAVPSLETIIAREVLWTSSFTLKIECNAASKTAAFPNMFMVNYGVTDALAPFPLSQLVSTITTTINNNSISMQMQDLLPALLRLIDPDELATYEGTTPTGNDYYANYRDGVDMLEYVIAKTTAGGGAARPCIYDVGPNVDAIEGITDFNGTTTQKFVSYPSNILAFDQERPGASYKHKARGSFIIKRISTSADNSTPSTIADTTIPDVSSTVVYVDIEVCEPILMSPFIFGSPENKQGFYGITNMNFQMNMAPNANRCWRSVKFKNTVRTGTSPNYVYTDYYLDKSASV
jgi:hypothetical protein